VHWEARFQDVAGRHEGLVARFHLPQIGCTSDHWSKALRTGRWALASPRVIRSLAAPSSEAQRVLAAILDASPGAVLHAATSLAWFDVPGYTTARLKVARPRGLSGTRPVLAELHQLRALRAHDVVVVRGIATETPLRALWGVAARYSSTAMFEIGVERIGAQLDGLHRRGLATWEALHEMVDDIHERGRSGTAIMRQLAQARPIGSSVTESRQEVQFEKVLAAHGLELPRRQRPLGGHEPIGRCDFADVGLPLAIEVNSLTYHTTPTDRAADERRYQALNDAGFTVCVVWEDDLWGRQRSVADSVLEARRFARRRHAVVVHSPGCPWPRPRVGEPADTVLLDARTRR